MVFFKGLIYTLLFNALISTSAGAATCEILVNYSCQEVGYAAGISGVFQAKQTYNCSNWSLVSTTYQNLCGTSPSDFIVTPPTADKRIQLHISYSCQEIGYPVGYSGGYNYDQYFTMGWAPTTNSAVNSCK